MIELPYAIWLIILKYSEDLTMSNERRMPDLVLKVDVKHALLFGKKVDLATAPKAVGSEIYIPSEALALIGIKTDKDMSPLSSVICKSAVSMNVILLNASEELDCGIENDYKYIVGLANEFIFDFPKVGMVAEYVPSSDEEIRGFELVGNYVLELLKKKGARHPYLLASDDIFEKLRSIYQNDDGSELHIALKKYVDSRRHGLIDFPPVYEDYRKGFMKPFPETGYGESEYDPDGGRHTVSESQLYRMLEFAFMARVTGEDIFAVVTYYACLEIGGRKHWGPGHFLNCAGAGAYMSAIYDWNSDIWRKHGLDPARVRLALYNQTVHHGYNSLINDTCDYPSPKQGTGWRFRAKPDNWNAVNNGGLIQCALCILGEEADELVTKEMLSKARTLLGGCLTSLTHGGLVYNQYAPDGSYVESASYWSYGTMALVKCMAALHTALGTDLGLHHGCGLDKTCYYALNSESAEFLMWDYHDGYLAGQSTDLFGLFAAASGDNMIYALREYHLSRGKAYSLYDFLFSPKLNGIELPSLDSLPTAYLMSGIDAFVVRNGWERGSIYAGIIGGENPTGGSHNHIDSGAFVYHNLGKLWITDLASDNYNIPNSAGGYFGNNGLYRRNAEGHNVVSLTSLPYGQELGKRGILYEVREDGGAPYAIIDNKAVYGDKVTAAERGMILIGGKTLVVQDHIELKEKDEAFSSLHYFKDKINAELSSDGRVCTLTHKDGERITVSLVGNGRMELTDTYHFLLTGTKTAEKEKSRDEFGRIVIRYDGDIIDSAVVIESDDSALYKNIIPLANWKSLA